MKVRIFEESNGMTQSLTERINSFIISCEADGLTQIDIQTIAFRKGDSILTPPSIVVTICARKPK